MSHLTIILDSNYGEGISVVQQGEGIDEGEERIIRSKGRFR